MQRTHISLAAVVVAAVAALPAASLAQQRVFSTPEEALDALVDASSATDRRALFEIFGPGADALLDSGDPVQDQRAVRIFAAAADEMARVVIDRGGPGEEDDRFVIYVGRDNWPFPVPLVRATARNDADMPQRRAPAEGWRFDTATGTEEVINRRVGRNELAAIEVARAYVDAQRAYQQVDRDGDEVPEYAPKFVSDRGTHNGLYWPDVEGDSPSPIGPLFARAAAEGYEVRGERTGPTPFHGYTFRILTSQGPDAPGGSYDYTINGNMVAGFGLLATPAQYGSSGIMTFMVGPGGVVYEQDLGEKTEEFASSITSFNPDQGWRRARD